MLALNFQPPFESRLQLSVPILTAILLFSLTPLMRAGSVPAVRSVVRVDGSSGRLVRSIQAVQPPSASVPVLSPAELESLVDRIADEHGVESPLVRSVIRAESNYNPSALSPKGARGLMQLIPATAQRFGVADVFDPKQNIAGGVKYLKFLLEYYKGDYVKAIAAYNAGEEAVDRYKGVPPYAETRNYVQVVSRNLKAARLRQAKVLASAAPSPAPPRERHPIQATVGADGKIYYRNP